MNKTDLKDLIKNSVVDDRVDVIKLAKSLGLEVYSKSMDDEKSGYITVDDVSGKTKIIVNETHPVTRQRFTIAHELGHYLKHPNILKEEGQLDRVKEYKSSEEIKMEQEADSEGAEILMPDFMVKKYFDKNGWTENTKFDATIIDNIAHHFFVSKTMAVTRLRKLNVAVPYLSFA